MTRNGQGRRRIWTGLLGTAAALLVVTSAAATTVVNEDAKLTASDGAPGDRLGWSSAIDGDTAVIGAYFDDSPLFNAGSAVVFTRSGSGWAEQAKLTAPDAAFDDRFGFSAAVSGDTIVVGAVNDDDGGSNSGSAYVFVRTGTSWATQAKLTAPDAAALDLFGWSVGISGDTIVVGAFNDDDDGSGSGSAYVFVRSGTSWGLQAKLTASDGTSFDAFGRAVGISGDRIVAGAPFDDDDGTASGSAYVFVRSGASWSEQAKVTASDATSNDIFGWSVGISGDTAVVGALSADDPPDFRSGAAYVFVRSGTAWPEQAKLTASDSATFDSFGHAVGISGDTIGVAAYQDDDAGSNSGSAYAFTRSGTVWTEQAKLVASDGSLGKQFGYSIGVSGGTLVVGAPMDDFAKGAGYVFDLVPPNTPPVADAGEDVTIKLTESVFLDGTGSADPEGDPLTYAWTITSAPGGSTAALVGDTSSNPALTPDVEGDYVVSLIVNDGTVDSDAADTVTITANGLIFAQNQLRAACDYVKSLPKRAFDRGHRKRKMCRKLKKIVRLIRKGRLEGAQIYLDYCIQRVDGCTLRGEPDTNDHQWWPGDPGPDPGIVFAPRADRIVDCDAQTAVYDLLDSARCILEVTDTIED